MVYSMTGYGRAEEQLNGRSVSVEIRSVNSRYFEYSSRLPRGAAFLDDLLKKAVSAAVSRGKVELHLSLQNMEGGGAQVSANLPVATGYYDALMHIADELHVEADITAAQLGRFPEVFTVTKTETDEEQLAADVMQVAGQALARHTTMRETEGLQLRADMEARLAAVETMLGSVEEDSAGRVRRYRDKLYERLSELLADTTVDEGRMLTEAAIFADRTAVDEETVRLRSHIEQFRGILEKGGSVGRKLDFLTQELNREVNTIGSKCQEVAITRLVVEMKGEIEKIREQIQNLE